MATTKMGLYPEKHTFRQMDKNKKNYGDGQGKHPCICSRQIKGYCAYYPSNIFKIFSLIAAGALFLKLT